MNVDIAAQLHGDDPEVGDVWLAYLSLRASSLVRWQWTGVEHVAAELLKRNAVGEGCPRHLRRKLQALTRHVFYEPNDT